MRPVRVALLALLALGLAGCGDEIEITGRFVPAGDGPGFSNAAIALDAYSFTDAWEHVIATSVLDENGRFEVTAARPDVSDLGLVLWVNAPNHGAQLTLFVLDEVVDLGDIAVWNPDLRVDEDGAGVAAQWNPPPADLEGRVTARLGDVNLDPADGEASVASWILEDRASYARLAWESDVDTESTYGLSVQAVQSIGPFSPSAAAGAACYVSRYDYSVGQQVDALIDPCLLTDRSDDTGVNLTYISYPRGVVVNLGSALPISHVVVRTKDAIPELACCSPTKAQTHSQLGRSTRP